VVSVNAKKKDDTGLRVTVAHLPPGTSKWNKIEHRLFSQITLNWRGRPPSSHQVIVDLIANTTTATGLSVRCVLNTGQYPTGTNYSDKDIAAIQSRCGRSTSYRRPADSATCTLSAIPPR